MVLASLLLAFPSAVFAVFGFLALGDLTAFFALGVGDLEVFRTVFFLGDLGPGDLEVLRAFFAAFFGAGDPDTLRTAFFGAGDPDSLRTAFFAAVFFLGVVLPDSPLSDREVLLALPATKQYDNIQFNHSYMRPTIQRLNTFLHFRLLSFINDLCYKTQRTFFPELY